MVPDALSRICPNSDIEKYNLGSILVEPSFLSRLSDAQFDPSDTEMVAYVEHARSMNPDFRIVERNHVPLLVKTKGSVE